LIKKIQHQLFQRLEREGTIQLHRIIFEIDSFSVTHTNLLAAQIELMGERQVGRYTEEDKRAMKSEMTISCKVIKHEITFEKKGKRK
jgi:hypothetical protein